MDSFIPTQPNLTSVRRHLSSRFDPEQRVLWVFMDPHPVPCFSPEALADIKSCQDDIASSHGHAIHEGIPVPIDYCVLASNAEGVFNYGGDLRLFERMIRARDRDGLADYARRCIDVSWSHYNAYGTQMTTVSLVQGDALGGGLEAALSSQVVIAEKRAQLGLPEIGFNLFPGMGAWSYLVRRVGSRVAHEMMTTRRIYTAQEMFEAGVVDVLVEDGEGEQAVAALVRRQSRSRRGFAAIQRVRQVHDPLTYAELWRIAELWVETALELEDRDLAMMARLVNAQQRLADKAEAKRAAAAPVSLRPIARKGGS